MIDPHTGEVVKNGLPAREIFVRDHRHAWRNGEPGMVFIDRMNKDNPTPQVGQIEANQPLRRTAAPANEACNLGSIT